MKKLLVLVFMLVSMMATAQRTGRQCKTPTYDADRSCYYAALVPTNFSGLSFCSCTVHHTPGTCIRDGVENFNEAVDPGDVVCTTPCDRTNVCSGGRSATKLELSKEKLDSPKDKTILPPK